MAAVDADVGAGAPIDVEEDLGVVAGLGLTERGVERPERDQ